jgi:GH24 family phage-related lysozyme (muramidase)
VSAQSSCTAGGKTGVCASSCSAGALVSASTGARGCESFPLSVKCCVVQACTTPSGGAGTCRSECSGQLFSSADGASGCGALPNDVRCCANSNAGGSGNGNNPSVLPSGPSCVAFGRGGACVRDCPSTFQHSASSPGQVSGCESFANDIKCCHPKVAGSGTGPSLPITSSDRVPASAVAIIKEFEGFYARAYPDPLSGGKPYTIGWGSTRRRDGSEFRLGDTITRAEAENLLIWQLETKYVPPMETSIPTWSSLNSNQRAALISFGYNLGAHWYGNRNFMSLTRVVRDRTWSKIRATLLLYRNPGSNVEQGLRRRRTAEADLFLRPMTNAAGLADDTPVPQEELTAADDEEMLDPSLHADNSLAIGLGVAGAVVAVALLVAVGVWCFISKRDKMHSAQYETVASVSMQGDNSIQH